MGPSSYQAAYTSAIGPSKEATLQNRHNQGGTAAFCALQGSIRPKQALSEPPQAGPQGPSAAPTMQTIGQSSQKRAVRFSIAGERLATEAAMGQVQLAGNSLAVPSFA